MLYLLTSDQCTCVARTARPTHEKETLIQDARVQKKRERRKRGACSARLVTFTFIFLWCRLFRPKLYVDSNKSTTVQKITHYYNIVATIQQHY